MKFLAIFSLVAAAAAAAAPGALEARGTVTCGKNTYTDKQVTSASKAACKLVQRGATVGKNKYPHVYRNGEGFHFKGLPGPFYEFPLLTVGIYRGGSPGPDRVVITKKCEEAGQITHTGAQGNKFVACSGTN